jgi:hypothetical protein
MPGTCIARRTSKWRPGASFHAHPLGNTKTERKAAAAREVLPIDVFAARLRPRPSGGAAWNRSLSIAVIGPIAPDRGVSPMPNWIAAFVLAVASFALAGPSLAQATDQGTELAFMPRTLDVTLLNEGGKYVAIDLKHIPQGGICRMDQDATIARMGPGASPGTTRVRYVAPQVSPGGCPFLTAFDLSDADYASARAKFVQMKEEATKKVEQLKKDLGDKWDEITGKKS